MDKEYLKNKIEGLRSFVESIHERAIGFMRSPYDKKMPKIKKKLARLMERCQKKITQDVTKTDQRLRIKTAI